MLFMESVLSVCFIRTPSNIVQAGCSARHTLENAGIKTESCLHISTGLLGKKEMELSCYKPKGRYPRDADIREAGAWFNVESRPF